VTNAGSKSVSVIDTSTNAVSYATDAGGKSVSVINTATNTVVATKLIR
jgi:DNA-binding beta-propeller fold protein YncE